MGHIIYWEDLKVGQVFETAKKTLNKQQMIDFAKEYDPQPMHLTDEGGEKSMFKQYIGSGWHTLCTTIRLMVEARPLGDTPLIGMQLDEIKFLKPLLPEATLQAKAEILELWPSKSNLKRGYMRLLVTTEADGEAIVSQRWVIPAERRI